MSANNAVATPIAPEPLPPSEFGMQAADLITAYLATSELDADDRMMASIPLAILDLADAMRNNL